MKTKEDIAVKELTVEERDVFDCADRDTRRLILRLAWDLANVKSDLDDLALERAKWRAARSGLREANRVLCAQRDELARAVLAAEFAVECETPHRDCGICPWCTLTKSEQKDGGNHGACPPDYTVCPVTTARRILTNLQEASKAAPQEAPDQ